MSFPVVVGLSAGQEKFTSSNKRGRMLGTKGQGEDGSVYRWTQNGAVALAGSVLVASPVQFNASGHTGGLELTSNISSGALQFTIAALAASGLSTLIDADQYADGYMTVDINADGLSGPYLIKANDAGTSLIAAQFTLHDNDPIKNAMTTISKIGIRENPYASVLVAPVSAVSTSLGVTPAPVAVDEFFWCQTGGWCQIEADAEVAANTQFILGATPGNIAVATSAAGPATPYLGWAQTLGAQGADRPQFVYLTIGF